MNRAMCIRICKLNFQIVQHVTSHFLTIISVDWANCNLLIEPIIYTVHGKILEVKKLMNLVNCEAFTNISVLEIQESIS